MSGGERYEPGEVIGRGAFGEVRRGRDRDLDRDVAIKLLCDPDGDGFADRLVEEARLGGRLQHPAIVPVYDLDEDPDGRPLLVMRLVGGETLADRLARRESAAEDRPRLLRIFVQVCQATAYAHERGVVHRDLRAEHVRIGPFGEVQVLEWGRAEERSAGDTEGEHTDVLALGEILDEILGSGVDSDLEAIRRRCVAAGTTARELADGVEAHLAAAEERVHRAHVGAARARAEADDQRRARRHGLIVLAAVLVLLTVGGLTVRAIERDRLERDRRTVDAVDEALELATARRAAGDDAGAEAAAKRALELAGDRHADRRRLAASLLGSIREEREATRRAADRARRDGVLLDRLEAVRARGQADPERVEAIVREAFRERGLDLEVPDACALELRGSTRAEPIAAALVACALLLPEDDLGLATLADAVDPDGRRSSDRAILHSGDADRIRGLARADLAPSLVGLVGRAVTDLDAAAGEAFLREAWGRVPDDPWTSFELAIALAGRRTPRWTEALRFASAAAARRPSNPTFRALAGRAMLQCGDLASARLAVRELVHRWPEFAPGHVLRGSVRFELGDLDGAIECCREALRLDDSLPLAHARLGEALLRRGRFAEALAAARRAQALAEARPSWHGTAPSGQLVADCELFLELEKSLPDIVAGRRRPKDRPEAASFARLCRATDHRATAARLYRNLYLAGRDVRRGYPRREGPIECAVLAGVGRGLDTDTLDEAARAEWRERALAWMTARRDDVARAPGRQGGRPGPGAIVATLRRWQENPSYAGVRDPEELARMPEAERTAWRSFWASIEAMIERLGGW